MKTQQQIILDAIVDELEQTRHVTVDFVYANTGYIRVIDATTLAATRSVTFDFQKTYVTFKVADSPDYIASHTYGKPRRDGQIAEVKSTPREVVDTVVAYLKGDI